MAEASLKNAYKCGHCGEYFNSLKGFVKHHKDLHAAPKKEKVEQHQEVVHAIQDLDILQKCFDEACAETEFHVTGQLEGAKIEDSGFAICHPSPRPFGQRYGTCLLGHDDCR